MAGGKSSNNKRDLGSYLNKVFLDINHPAGFSHPAKLLNTARTSGFPDARLTDVQSVLQSIPAYRLHKQRRNKYSRMTTIAHDAHERWQVDLMSLGHLSTYNEDVKYILLVVDVFSRFVMGIPLTNKSGKEVRLALELIFMKSGFIPKIITSDKGKEFTGSEFKNLLRKYRISQYFSLPNRTKASIIERVIKTIRMKLGKFMTHTKSKKILDVIHKIMESYNESIHSTVGMSPFNAMNSIANRQLALFNLNQKIKKQPLTKWTNNRTPGMIKEGDTVHVPTHQTTFTKSSDPTFVPTTSRVTRVFPSLSNRPVYRLSNRSSVFYPQTLSKSN